jgi:mannose-6-phosphate isomerase-like protein (cupin superfamily)
MADNILDRYLHVRDGDRTDAIPPSPSFWQDLAGGAYPQLDRGRLMSAFTFSEPWASWERHPAGEEVVLLISGAAKLLIEESGGERSVRLALPGDYVLVPQGAWHTAKTNEPTTMLFLTPGAGTEHRPIGA